MIKQKSKAFYNMLLSQAFGNSTAVLLTNKNNRDGKAIMKLLDGKETLKLVVFHGNKQGFLPNTVYTFHKQENKPKCFSYFGLYNSCEKCLVAKECEEKAQDLAEEYGLETSQDI